jgi:hypothetical protein
MGLPRRALCWLLVATGPAWAGTAYRCEPAGGGAVVYQQSPCAKGQRQQVLQLDGSHAAVEPAVPVKEATAAAEDVPAPAPPAAAPLPLLFRCVRATDGTTYTSHQGDPQPYAVPLGVVGNLGATLSSTYGHPGNATASAPELNRGRGNVGAITGSNYVWVQDACRPLSAQETCSALAAERDDVQRQIRNAFKSDRPPLDAREAALESQLGSCR